MKFVWGFSPFLPLDHTGAKRGKAPVYNFQEVRHDEQENGIYAAGFSDNY
jgi:hypothetical protein